MLNVQVFPIFLLLLQFKDFPFFLWEYFQPSKEVIPVPEGKSLQTANLLAGVWGCCLGVTVSRGQHVRGVSILHPLSWSCANARLGVGKDCSSGMWKSQSPS